MPPRPTAHTQTLDTLVITRVRRRLLLVVVALLVVDIISFDQPIASVKDLLPSEYSVWSTSAFITCVL
jgi:hypothetical protein